MGEIQLDGVLVCRDPESAAVVRRHLPAHVALTRGEPGCLAFDVDPSDDPFVWTVHERFSDDESFRAHQARVAASEWGRVTSGIERRYEIRAAAD
ncbi:MAG: antibiotic biosynthesis monooxygenase [Brevundimonas sp.]